MNELQIHPSTGETYPVTFGHRIENNFDSFWKRISDQRSCVMVIDEQVEELHGDHIEQMIVRDCGFNVCYKHVVPSGEASKNWNQYRMIVDESLRQGVLRQTPLVAIGGGVTGDLGGFAASSIMRGIPLIHIPTTLLAMVDSSIGGKTGINHQKGKNLVGAFYQPSGVWVDTQWLETLDRRDWVNGISEILKYGYIADRDIFDQVATLDLSVAMDTPESMLDIIRQSVRVKAEIVQQDATERGLRAVLNFGHTFGHALEALGEYGALAHGEAVYAGMIAAIEASNILGARLKVEKLLSFKNWYNLRLHRYRDHIEELIKLMKQDKKSTEEGIRLVLLHDWGSPYVSITNEKIIRTSMERMFEHFA